MNIGMIRKILIANRGEIAVRIIRACREMGIASVAVYSEADRESLHTQLADEAICIGPAASADSYLSMERVLSAAITSGADAIHPGFGFLSENSKFAALCEQCGLVFIGPKAEVIQKMGHKSQARNTMSQAGVPVIPGTTDPVYHAKDGLEEAGKIGYPVMIKAEKECVYPIRRKSLNVVSVPLKRKRRWRSGTERCIWNILCGIRDILNFRSLRICLEM